MCRLWVIEEMGSKRKRSNSGDGGDGGADRGNNSSNRIISSGITRCWALP